jgi:hypothetical protein
MAAAVAPAAAFAAAQAGSIGAGFRCACSVRWLNSARKLERRAGRPDSCRQLRTLPPTAHAHAPTHTAHAHARSGAGFILPFLLGVVDMLYRDLGVMHADMPAAGASGGAIAVA